MLLTGSIPFAFFLSFLGVRIMTSVNVAVPDENDALELLDKRVEPALPGPSTSAGAALPRFDPSELSPYWNDFETILGPGMQPVPKDDFIDPRELAAQNTALEGCNGIIQMVQDWFTKARVRKGQNWQPKWWLYFVEWVEFFDAWRQCTGVRFYEDWVTFEMLWLASKLTRDVEKMENYESLIPMWFDSSEISAEVTEMLKDLNMPIVPTDTSYPKTDAGTEVEVDPGIT